MFLRLRKTGPRLDASCQSLRLGASPQTPGIYRFDPNPEARRTSEVGCPARHPASVLGPESALGLLPSIALSSAQAVGQFSRGPGSAEPQICNFLSWMIESVRQEKKRVVNGTGGRGPRLRKENPRPGYAVWETRTRALRVRQLPTDHAIAVPTRAYQNDHRRCCQPRPSVPFTTSLPKSGREKTMRC